MATKQTKPMSLVTYLVIMAVVTLLVIGVAVVAGRMVVADIILQSKVQSAKTKANNQVLANLAAAPKLVDSYHKLGATAALLNDALPNNSDIMPVDSDTPGFVAMVENIALQSGVALKSYTPSVETTSLAAAGADMPTPQAVGATLSIDCTYQSLQKLLGNLETSARVIRVNSIQLSGSASKMTAQLDITTYYMSKATIPFKQGALK